MTITFNSNYVHFLLGFEENNPAYLSPTWLESNITYEMGYGRFNDEREVAQASLEQRIYNIKVNIDFQWKDQCLGPLDPWKRGFKNRFGKVLDNALYALCLLIISVLSNARVFLANQGYGIGGLGEEMANRNEALRRLEETLNVVNKMSFEEIRKNGVTIKRYTV